MKEIKDINEMPIQEVLKLMEERGNCFFEGKGDGKVKIEFEDGR